MIRAFRTLLNLQISRAGKVMNVIMSKYSHSDQCRQTPHHRDDLYLEASKTGFVTARKTRRNKRNN